MKDHPSQGIHSGLTCRDLTDRASEYLDGRLPILTKVLVGLHLASCTPCRAYVKQINLVSSALRSLPNLYPSPVHRLRLRQQFAASHTTLERPSLAVGFSPRAVHGRELIIRTGELHDEMDSLDTLEERHVRMRGLGRLRDSSEEDNRQRRKTWLPQSYG